MGDNAFGDQRGTVDTGGGSMKMVAGPGMVHPYQMEYLGLFPKHRDVVLEASASARGGLGAVFLAGSASARPHMVLSRSRPYCLGLGSAS